MLGLSWTEMLVVGVVALIVIGPKDLPIIMKRVGQFVGQVRRMGNDFQREINRTTGLDEVRNLRQSITEPLRKSTEEIRRDFNAMTPKGPKPSGLIKPSEPGKESVADEIRAAAGMPPAPSSPVQDAATVTPKPASAEASPASAEPAKPVRATRRSLAVERDAALKAQEAQESRTKQKSAAPAKPASRSRAKPKANVSAAPDSVPVGDSVRPKRTRRSRSAPVELAQDRDASSHKSAPKRTDQRRKAPMAADNASEHTPSDQVDGGDST